MNQEEVVKKVREEAKEYFKKSCSSHNWSHVERVYNLCVFIGERENADLFVLKLAALLHDCGREEEIRNPKNLDHAVISERIASKVLLKYKVDKKVIDNVLHCILSHRFRKERKPESKEAKILFDADKLDSIGALGVARAFMWAGKKGLSIYSDKNFLGTSYEKDHSPMVEFEFKLKEVKNRLFTQTAKSIAQERHEFMVKFFDRLKKEVKGEL